MKVFIYLLLICGLSYSSEIEEYKKKILELDEEVIWQLQNIKFEDSRIWYFSDGGIKKVWSPLGACRAEVKTECADCSCDYYFKSSHPNNRFIGDFPYETVSEGYPQSPNKLPSTGCMQVDGARGACSFNNKYKLCNISDNYKAVFKEYIRYAFNDKKDPCGINEFFYTKYKDLALEHELINPKKVKIDSIKSNDKVQINDSER